MATPWLRRNALQVEIGKGCCVRVKATMSAPMVGSLENGRARKRAMCAESLLSFGGKY